VTGGRSEKRWRAKKIVGEASAKSRSVCGVFVWLKWRRLYEHFGSHWRRGVCSRGEEHER